MTTAEYLQRGEALDYTNATDELIPAGAIVVVGDRIGVTGCPIPAGNTGTLHMVGVFEIAKTGTAAIEMGKTVYFDGTGITDAAEAADTGDADTGDADTGDNKAVHIEAGYAAAPADAADTTILVKLRG